MVPEMRVELTKLKTNNQGREDWSIFRRDDAIQDRYAVEVPNRYTIFSANEEEEGIEKDWRVHATGCSFWCSTGLNS